jgi:polyphosphate kinase 2 (PPK2 family)
MQIDSQTTPEKAKLKRKEYEKELHKLQIELCQLQEWVRHQGLRIFVIFEGRDGAGKAARSIQHIKYSLEVGNEEQKRRFEARIEGSVADRRKIHAASMLYHIQNGSVPKLAGTSN